MIGLVIFTVVCAFVAVWILRWVRNGRDAVGRDMRALLIAQAADEENA